MNLSRGEAYWEEIRTLGPRLEAEFVILSLLISLCVLSGQCEVSSVTLTMCFLL